MALLLDVLGWAELVGGRGEVEVRGEGEEQEVETLCCLGHPLSVATATAFPESRLRAGGAVVVLADPGDRATGATSSRTRVSPRCRDVSVEAARPAAAANLDSNRCRALCSATAGGFAGAAAMGSKVTPLLRLRVSSWSVLPTSVALGTGPTKDGTFSEAPPLVAMQATAAVDLGLDVARGTGQTPQPSGLRLCWFSLLDDIKPEPTLVNVQLEVVDAEVGCGEVDCSIRTSAEVDLESGLD